jgi:sugar lactone lactonase YvrE
VRVRDSVWHVTHRAIPACPQVHVLAEGPVWDPVRQRVLWVDINGRAVHTGTLSGDQVVPQDVLTFTETVGTVVCSEAGDLLVAGARALHVVSPDGVRTPGPQLIPATKASRLNDGTCDAAGRFLVGTLALDDREGEEQLMQVASDQVTVLDDDLGLSNGLGFSPDGSSFYSIDTDAGLVRIRSYDAATGHVGARRELLQITDGHPDGMCVDIAGNLWIAIWGAGQVRCYSPAGEHLTTVEVAAPNTSSVAFVGPALDLLLITTASEQLTPGQLAQFPDSGKLFTCRPGVTGLPVPPWAGR